jgi:PAS domain S-box-containing protein
MSNATFIALVNNGALLLALALIFDVLVLRSSLRKTPVSQVLLGIVLGVIGVAIMNTPWILVPGIIFDTRSVLLGIAGLFFGPLPTFIAILITAAFRLSTGGAAAWVGVFVILSAGGLGMAWRHHRRASLADLTWWELYGFGWLIHLVMLALMCALPWEMALRVLSHVTLPVLAIHPLATALLGTLMVKRIQQEQTREHLRASEQKFRAIADYTTDWEMWFGPDKQLRWVNPSVERLTGYSVPECLARPDFPWFVIHPEDQAALRQRLEREVTTLAASQELEFRILRKNGSQCWGALVSQPIFDEQGLSLGRRTSIRDVTERKRVEATQQFLLQNAGTQAGESFFQALAHHLAIKLEMDFVCIDRLEGDQLRAQTLAVFADGKFQDNLSYALKDTPCGDVVGKAICTFPVGVRNLFPKDTVLQEMGAESYFGTTLWGRQGTPIGLIAVISRRPCPNAGLVETILNLVALRAAGELERQSVENALRTAEERYRLLIENTSDHITRLNTEGMVVFASGAIQLLQGFTPQEVEGTSGLARVHPDDLPLVKTALEGLGSSPQGSAKAEYRVMCKNGSYKWVEAVAKAVPNEQTGKLEYVASIRDISLRKLASEALAASEKKFRSYIESAPEGIMVVDGGGRYVECNSAALTLFGFSLEEMLQISLQDVLAVTSRAAGQQHFMQVKKEGRASGEILLRRRDGSEFWGRIEAVRLDAELILGFITDTTEQKRAAQALQESEARLLRAQAVAHVGNWELDLTTQTVWASAEAFRIYGLEPSSKFPPLTEVQQFPVPEDRPRLDQALRALVQDGIPYDVEFRIRRIDDQAERVIHSLASLEGNPKTGPAKVIGVLQDITERKRVELAISASLTEKTALLKEVHHRVKNNLQIVSSLLSMQAGRTKNPEVLELLKEAQQRIRSMGLIHESLYLSENVARVNFSDYIQTLSAQLFRSFGPGTNRIRLRHETGSIFLPLAQAVPCGLILNELVTNALKYAFPGNREGQIHLELRTEPGLLHLRISDDGAGLPPELVIGKTETLGLQLVFLLANQLGGTLTVERAGGTSYSLKIPIQELTGPAFPASPVTNQ